MKKTAQSSKKSKSTKSQKAGKTFEETFKVNGEELLGKVKDLVKEGNIRRLIIKDNKGRVVIEFPLTVGVVITVLLPVFAAIGALAALMTECSITVVREV
jgi:hypothetical protein